MKEINEVSIEWESTGYSVLKNLNATILGVFCEFIDNSIQSYKNKKNIINESEKNYKLRIEILHTDDEIIITDNAGGIDYDNFLRCIKPANRPDNTEGLHEFGLGMKYAAVWLSNEWELISTAIGEEDERRVIFNYKNVVEKNLKKLPTKLKKVDKSSHYTTIKLRKLESKHVHGYKWKILNEKLSSIYRNFLRKDDEFFKIWQEDQIELFVNHEQLTWKESGFLKAQWWKDRQAKIEVHSPVREWKYKFDWMPLPYKEEVLENDEIITKDITIEVSGFIGILPNAKDIFDGKQKGKNGFTLFRRGRMVEGMYERIFPKEISSSSVRANQYIRLYGEIHFRNVNISFDKTKLSINRNKRDHIFQTIAMMLKRVEFDDGVKLNLLRQGQDYKANWERKTAVEAIESLSQRNKNRTKSTENEILENEVAKIVYDESYEKLIKDEHINSEKNLITKETVISTKKIGTHTFTIEFYFSTNTKNERLFTINNNCKEIKTIKITLNMKHKIVRSCIEGKNNTDKDRQLDLVCGFVELLAISKVRAESGGNLPQHVLYAFNDYIGTINWFNETNG